MQSNWDELAESFDAMGLKEHLLRGIYAYGFEKPSSIQQRGIVPCIRGRDVIAQAQSGTGKTATYAIAILQRIDPELKATQALVLAPTRELAQQIQKVILALGDYMNITCLSCIGGTRVREDQGKLEAGGQVVVGTPGRVYDMIQRRSLRMLLVTLFSAVSFILILPKALLADQNSSSIRRRKIEGTTSRVKRTLSCRVFFNRGDYILLFTCT